MTSLLNRCTVFGSPLSVLLRSTQYLRPTNRTNQTAATASDPNPSSAPTPIPTTTTSKQESIVAPVPAHIKAIVDQISQLKFYEVNLLTEALKRELKIPEVQRVVAAGSIGLAPSAEEATTASVKTAFTVKLVKFDDSKKVALIKEVKKLVEGINLVEAKRFVEDLPKTIKSNASKDEAEALQKQLEAVGAVVKLD